MNDALLEERLTAMFERRAEDIRTAPSIDFSSVSTGRTRLNLAPFAVAASIAVVVLAAGGTVVGIRSIHHPHAPVATSATSKPPTKSTQPAFVNPNSPTDASGNCLFIPPVPTADWNTAIRNGTKVALDHPDNEAISVNGATAEYLVVQSTPNTAQNQDRYGQWTLSLFQGASGQDLVDSPAGTPESPIADPSAAISADWIVYGLVHPQQNDGYFKVQLFNRSTKAVSTIDEVSDAQYTQGSEFVGTPVIYDNHVYWIEGKFHQPGASVLKSYDLQSGTQSSVPAANALGLLAYGNGLAIIDKDDSHSWVINHLGTPLPGFVLNRMNGLSQVGYAGPTSVTTGQTKVTQSNISWVVPQGGNEVDFYNWAQGTEALWSESGTSMHTSMGLPSGPFAAQTDDSGKSEILDDRVGVRNSSPYSISLPAGLQFEGLVGPDLLFSVNQTKDGAASFLLVKASSLPKPVDYPGC